MSVQLCDRCGDVTVDDEPCRCRTPFDPMQVRRRHGAAVAAARRSDAAGRAPDRRVRVA